MLFPLLGDTIARLLDRAWMRHMLAGSGALVLAAMLAIACQLQFDWLGGSLSAVTRSDPTAEGLDWTSLQHDLRARGLLPPGALVAALNWRDAGKIGYGLGPDCDHAVPEFRTHASSASPIRRATTPDRTCCCCWSTQPNERRSKPKRGSEQIDTLAPVLRSIPRPRAANHRGPARPHVAPSAMSEARDHGTHSSFMFRANSGYDPPKRDQTKDRPVHSRRVTPGSREADDECTSHYRPA